MQTNLTYTSFLGRMTDPEKVAFASCTDESVVRWRKQFERIGRAIPPLSRNAEQLRDTLVGLSVFTSERAAVVFV